MNVYLNTIKSYLPKWEIDNNMLSRHLDTDSGWIIRNTGIEKRWSCVDENPKRPAAFLGAKAFSLLDELDKDTVELIISGSSMSDTGIPNIASCIAMDTGLKIPGIGINTACSSFLSCLSMAKGLIQQGVFNKIAIVCTEPFTWVMNYADRRDSVLFGDGSSVAIVSGSPYGFKIGSFEMSGFGSEIVSTTDKAASVELNIQELYSKETGYKINEKKSYGCFSQNGRSVFSEVSVNTPRRIKSFLSKNKVDSFDYFIGHQANLRLLEKICKKLELNDEQHLHCVENTGNTGCVGAPMTLGDNWDKISQGSKVVMSVYGGGFMEVNTIFEKI